MANLDLGLEITRPAKRRRYFTVAQANRSLVLVKRVVADVILGYQDLLDLQEMLEVSQVSGRNMQSCRARMQETVENLQNCLDELEEMGVEIRDWALGVVDFPAMADGREVLLCWQFGEPKVMYWHEMNAADAGRQPIKTLPIEMPILT